jgi:hypothetical protein
MALSPLAGLDPRTMARLAGPVTAAANLLGEVKAAFRAYETSRGRLPRPLMDVPQLMSRFN